MDWLTSRKFVGTVVLTVLGIVDANTTFQVPDSVLGLWAAWMVVEGAVDVTSTIKGKKK